MTEIDNNEPNITGGYLIEIDRRAREEEKYFVTKKGIIGEIKYPDSDDITKEQENYIKQYLNELEKRVYNDDFSYIDLDSFYKYFLMQEFSGDIDFLLSSFHCTKRRNDDKLYFGPVWDYDLSFDNEPNIFPTNEKQKFVLYYGGSSGSTRNFIVHIIKIKEIMSNINQTWFQLQEEGLNFGVLNSFIEEKTELLIESGNLNFLRWYDSKIGEGKIDYLNSIKVVVNYIRGRFDKLTILIKEYDFSRENLKICFLYFFSIFDLLF